MEPRVSEQETSAYYAGALLALRFIEEAKPTGRRFGKEADARWSSFRGDLTTADRIDLLIRDANAQWPDAFGARTVFALRAVAEDEPFGASFSALDPVDAEALWRKQVAAPPARDVGTLLHSVAQAWGLRLSTHDPGAISPADKLVVAGPSALAALIPTFASGGDLDWSDQVVAVATPPAHRQLAALAIALTNRTKAGRIFTSSEGAPLRGHRVIVSADADPADVARARELAR